MVLIKFIKIKGMTSQITESQKTTKNFFIFILLSIIKQVKTQAKQFWFQGLRRQHTANYIGTAICSVLYSNLMPVLYLFLVIIIPIDFQNKKINKQNQFYTNIILVT